MLFIEKKVIVKSWGVSQIKVASDNIAFSVDGMKYKGNVVICISSDKQCVIYFDNGNVAKCDTGNVVNLLDKLIEHTDSYISDLSVWLKAKLNGKK